MNPSYPCIESTIDFQHKQFTIRLWLNETSLNNDRDLKVDIVKIRDYIFTHPYTLRIELADWVAKNIMEINAVQVIESLLEDSIKYGTVIYTVAFEEGKDPHG